MKKLMLAFAMLFCIFSITTIKSFAWDEHIVDCKYMCPGIDWQTHGTTTVTYGFCTYKYYWSYRYVNCMSNYSYCDYKIDKIEQIGSCSPAPTAYFLMQNGIKAIIAANVQNTQCALAPGECHTNISVSYSGCWYWDGLINSGTMKPCDESMCCSDSWNVCSSAGGIITVTLIAHIGTNPICPSGQCFAICEETH